MERTESVTRFHAPPIASDPRGQNIIGPKAAHDVKILSITKKIRQSDSIIFETKEGKEAVKFASH